MTIRERVEQACQRSGHSLSQLAREIGISPPGFIKSLDSNSPTYKRIDDLAKVIGVPAGWIRNGGPTPWESSKVGENTVKYGHLEDEVRILKRTIATLATRYIDLANLCREKDVDVPSTAIEDVKSLLESL